MVFFKYLDHLLEAVGIRVWLKVLRASAYSLRLGILLQLDPIMS